MSEQYKLAGQLIVSDLEANPVWEFVNDDGVGETAIRPVKISPVTSLSGKLIGTQVSLANGHNFWAVVGNVDEANPRLTEHFLTISIERAGKWFFLARYHDVDYSARGPSVLAEFLHLKMDDVFPISYDLQRFVKDPPPSLAGKIYKEPRERLTRDEWISLATLEAD